MRFIAGLIVIVSLMIGVTSCQKEIDWGLNNRTQSDSTVLAKYIEFDTTFPTGLDTILITTLNYDNSGRLSASKNISKDLNVPPTTVFPFFENYIFSYNGNDTVPYKVTISHSDALGNSNDTVYLFYANGKVVRDSMRSRGADFAGFPFEYIAVNLFVDNGNSTTVTKYITFTLNPPNWPPACPGTDIVTKTYVNGNITSEIGNYTDCSGIGMSEANFVYDNSPNPGFPFRIPYSILQGFWASNQKNNVVESWTSPGVDWYKYAYTYRSDGYPLVLRAYEVADPTNAWKGLYIYK